MGGLMANEIVIQHGDCIKLIKSIEDESIDLINNPWTLRVPYSCKSTNNRSKRTAAKLLLRVLEDKLLSRQKTERLGVERLVYAVNTQFSCISPASAPLRFSNNLKNQGQ